MYANGRAGAGWRWWPRLPLRRGSGSAEALPYVVPRLKIGVDLCRGISLGLAQDERGESEGLGEVGKNTRSKARAKLMAKPSVKPSGYLAGRGLAIRWKSSVFNGLGPADAPRRAEARPGGA